MKLAGTIRTLCLTAAVAAGAVPAVAQGPGGGGGMRGGGGMGMPSGGGRMGGPERRGMPGGGSPSQGKGSSGTARGSMAPTGRWWDDKKFAKTIGITGDQQKRMDTIFQQNRDTLQQRYDTFVKAQAKLDALKQQGNASETALFSEIDHTAQAHAELEQAYTHMQLQLRGEMTADQIIKLDERH